MVFYPGAAIGNMGAILKTQGLGTQMPPQLGQAPLVPPTSFGSSNLPIRLAGGGNLGNIAHHTGWNPDLSPEGQLRRRQAEVREYGGLGGSTGGSPLPEGHPLQRNSIPPLPPVIN